MALHVQTLTREFLWEKSKTEKIKLADINPDMTPEEVIKMYIAQHSALTNAKIEGPVVVGDKAVYKVTANAGRLG